MSRKLLLSSRGLAPCAGCHPRKRTKNITSNHCVSRSQYHSICRDHARVFQIVCEENCRMSTPYTPPPAPPNEPPGGKASIGLDANVASMLCYLTMFCC